MNPDDRKICFCHDVMKSEILEVFQTHGCTLEIVQAETCASTGCGGCEVDVRALIREHEAELAKKTKPAVVD